MVETGVIIGVIIGLSELIKRLGLSAKVIPVINLILGVVFYLMLNTGGKLEVDIFNGIIIGLTASGLYSGAKNVWEGIKEDDQNV